MCARLSSNKRACKSQRRLHIGEAGHGERQGPMRRPRAAPPAAWLRRQRGAHMRSRAVPENRRRGDRDARIAHQKSRAKNLRRRCRNWTARASRSARRSACAVTHRTRKARFSNRLECVNSHSSQKKSSETSRTSCALTRISCTLRD